jgi:putative transposase
MTQHPADYPWSSYAFNAEGKLGLNTNWLAPHDEYLRLGQNDIERQTAYQALFKADLSTNDLVQIRECTHKGWALGGQRFIDEIERLTKRQATSKGIGRPKKVVSMAE